MEQPDKKGAEALLERGAAEAPEYRTIGNCDMEIPRAAGIIIFGASGDLTKRKLLPSLYRLFKTRILPGNFFILGTSRVEMTTEQFRTAMEAAVKSSLPRDFDRKAWDAFAPQLYYSTFDYSDGNSYIRELRDRLPELEKKHRTGGNRIFYLAIPPTVFEDVIHNLGAAGLAGEERGRSQVVVEKPFGSDLASARKLNALMHTYYRESQIYRIDHYLAKETVQNILMFRFANSIFEPLWNRRYIDHVQITAAETIGIEHRAGYYEDAGVIRDMFQNHMFQLLALTAMEPPAGFEADRVRDEKIKVFRAIRPFPTDKLEDCIAVGQYDQGTVQGTPVPGYREEPGVSARSKTPTFAAMKIHIDNWRWNGVPFYLRSGKRLPRRMTEISIHYRPVPHFLFPPTVEGPIEPNVLVLRVQPDDGMSLFFQAKLPGTKVCLAPVVMDYAYPRDVELDAYEWVLLDCMQGDHMLFTREDDVEQSWTILSPAIEKLESSLTAATIPRYAAGSAGPAVAQQLIERDGRSWRQL